MNITEKKNNIRMTSHRDALMYCCSRKALHITYSECVCLQP